MAKFELKLPAMGEGIIEATITKWFIEEGSAIEEDHSLVEVATDKVDSEIPSPVNGILKKIVYREGEIPKVGEVIAIIETSNDIAGSETSESFETDDNDSETASGNFKKPDTEIQMPEMEYSGNITEFQSSHPARKSEYLSPFVKNLAKQRGIPISELQHIKGTGTDNRLTREDLKNYILAGRPYRFASSQLQGEIADPPQKEKSPGPGNDVGEIIEMDRVRKLIADNMLKSKKTAPHVTSFIEADVTELVNWRESIKNRFIEKEGVNLTYTALITSAVAKALKEYPKINSSVDGDKILIKKEINIGLATALTNGNLIVAVIKQADKDNLKGLASKISDLTRRARENKLLPTEIKGSTFTITNIGQYNSLTGTPIINQPEVAILAVGTIRKKPAVVNVNETLTIGIRDIVMLSLTYDHRIIDGALGGSFLNSIAQKLENFDTSEYV
ncbi:MAG: 2-oxo acid dehydrogenase subunit E2 [Bacteroidales bacterium]|nr:2-oxo acid dehydrogenase subunit E2 [Bacteroidales bacterium]